MSGLLSGLSKFGLKNLEKKELYQEEKKKGQDILWFLWCAPGSPLFGRNKMATFEGYFIKEKPVNTCLLSDSRNLLPHSQ